MQDYLTKDGVKIYKKIEALLKDSEKDHLLDTWELSRLADAYDKYHKASKEVNEKYLTDTDNKAFSQTGTYLTWKESGATITKLSPQFGLTPKARQVLGFDVKREEEDELSKYIS
jgi:P27 family predicted phage terminase small subunit